MAASLELFDRPTIEPSEDCPVPCMTRNEWAAWWSVNEVAGSERATWPCTDCTWEHADAMRAAGRCSSRPKARTPIVPSGDAATDKRRAQWRLAQRRRRRAA